MTTLMFSIVFYFVFFGLILSSSTALQRPVSALDVITIKLIKWQQVPLWITGYSTDKHQLGFGNLSRGLKAQF